MYVLIDYISHTIATHIHNPAQGIHEKTKIKSTDNCHDLKCVGNNNRIKSMEAFVLNLKLDIIN